MVAKFDRSQIPPAPDFRFEAELWAAGVRYVAGIDEAGRGCLAGPLVAAALVFPPDPLLAEKLRGVRDSKELKAAERQRLSERIRNLALTWAVGCVSPQEIDQLGISAATRLAMFRALASLTVTPEHLLIDFFRLPDQAVPQTALVKGDARSLSIASASILAKTFRDSLLVQLDAEFPGYGFAVHKGYATQAHRKALARLGPCSIHRLSFRLKNAVEPTF